MVVALGDETVEQAGAAGGREGVKDRLPVLRSDEIAGKRPQQSCSRIRARHAIAELYGNESFPYHLVGGDHYYAFIRQLIQAFQAIGVRIRRLTGDQPNEDGRINPDCCSVRTTPGTYLGSNLPVLLVVKRLPILDGIVSGLAKLVLCPEAASHPLSCRASVPYLLQSTGVGGGLTYSPPASGRTRPPSPQLQCVAGAEAERFE